MEVIKFGTDGWRALIGKEFTVENVCRIASAVAQYIRTKNLNKKVVVGYDCRFGGELFATYVSKVLIADNIEVIISTGYVTTPMISLAANHLNCGLGIIITASHNPPSYNGFKLKNHFGGPMLSDNIRKVEKLIPDTFDYKSLDSIQLEESCYIDLRKYYMDYLKDKFNTELIKNSGINICYNPMFGSGQGVLNELVGADEFHSELNPSFKGISPEPIPKNLIDYHEYLASSKKYDIGVIVDGDADRIAFADGKGNYIDSHHTMLLLIYILKVYKKMDGEIATGFSSTVKIKTLAERYNIPLTIVPIGFKHISGLMVDKDILMGGEESGGIAIKGHIPERDGIFNALTVLQFLAEENKTITELIEEVYSITGSFKYQRIDLTLPNDQKESIIEKLKKEGLEMLGKTKVERTETLDGFKFYLNKNEWVMVRASGTEPLLRLYCEAESEINLSTYLNDLKIDLKL